MPRKASPVSDDALKPVSLAIADLRTLILALQAPEPEVAGKACDAIERFADASDRNKITVVESGGVPSILKLLNSEVESLRNRASLCIFTLTRSFDVRLKLRGDAVSNLIEQLMPLLAPQASPVAHENASGALSHLATEYTPRQAIFRAGALPRLVPLLGASDPAIIRNSINCISALLDDYEARQAIAGLNAFELLTHLLTSEYNELQRSALNVISKCARNQDSRYALYEMNILDKIIAFVRNEEYHASHVTALEALASMLQEPEAMKRVSSVAEGNAPLADVVNFVLKDDVKVKLAAMGCIARAAHNADNRRVLMDFKAEKALISQMLPEDPKQPLVPAISIAACRALTALCAGKSNAEVAGGLDALPRLHKLINTDAAELAAAACETMAMLTAHLPANRPRVMEAGSLPRLIELLRGEYRPARTYAAAVISNLAKELELRDTMANTSSPVAALLECLSVAARSNSDTHSYALQALATLAAQPQLRSEMREAKPVEVIIAKINSTEDHVRRAAARFVAAACMDALFAALLYDSGVLAALQQVQASLPHPSNFVEMAMQELLRHHLPAKYAITGRLTVNDYIRELFYDPGQLKPDTPLPSLQCLLQSNINNQRAVLLINPAGLTDAASIGVERLPVDTELDDLVSQVKAKASNLQLEDRAGYLADLIATRMGGPVPISRMKHYNCDMHLAELKLAQQSNVIPIGKILKGTYCHRALLFKFLADTVKLPTALVRGQYGRVYNVMYTRVGPCVVDVMHKPGGLVAIADEDHLRENHPFNHEPVYV